MIIALSSDDDTFDIAGKESGLTLAVQANTTYILRAYLYGNNGNGMKYAIVGPTGATIAGFVNYHPATGIRREEITSFDTFTTITMTTNFALADFWACVTIGETAGYITIKFGSTIDATQGFLYTGSTLMLDELIEDTFVVRSKLDSDFSTTVDTAQDTGLEVEVEAGSICLVCSELIVDGPAGGMKLAVNCPGGSTVAGWIESSSSNLTSIIYEQVTDINTLTSSIGATARGVMNLRLVVHVAADGYIKLQACSTTSGQTTLIGSGSFLEVLPGVEDV